MARGTIAGVPACFTTYHEREVYLDHEGDLLELISAFYPDGVVKVWVSYFDGSNSDNLVSVDVTGTLQAVKYYLTIDDGIYRAYLKDTSSGEWYSGSYDDSDDPGTRITWLVGSTEIYYNSISKSFRTVTYPITTDYIDDKGSMVRPDTAFTYWDRTPSELYVYVDGWFDAEGKLITKHISANTQP
jgi:hypothetical protein